ncbi:hypothetical protein C5S31_01165 [ANME-1 cluster archaeon GoMg2]|nr:hypothetical protein [ANME-1 cluster archaeon GoMg2]
MKLLKERKRLRREVVEVRDKTKAFGIVLVFLLSATVGRAYDSGGAGWTPASEFEEKCHEYGLL